MIPRTTASDAPERPLDSLTRAGELDGAVHGSELLPRRLLKTNLVDHRRKLVAAARRGCDGVDKSARQQKSSGRENNNNDDRLE